LDAIRVEQTVRIDSYKEGKAEGIEEGRKEKEAAIKKAKQEKEAALKKAEEKAQQEKDAAVEKTKKVEKIEIAKMLLLQGIGIETIAKATTLSNEEIERLGERDHII
jgi:hypothetical protein